MPLYRLSRSKSDLLFGKFLEKVSEKKIKSEIEAIPVADLVYLSIELNLSSSQLTTVFSTHRISI